VEASILVPFVEHLSSDFKCDDAGVVVVLEVLEVCIPLEVVLGETLLNLLEDDFVLGSMASSQAALHEDVVWVGRNLL
jgi:hypothetical protein